MISWARYVARRREYAYSEDAIRRFWAGLPYVMGMPYVMEARYEVVTRCRS
jgi:hypothetical protein